MGWGGGWGGVGERGTGCHRRCMACSRVTGLEGGLGEMFCTGAGAASSHKSLHSLPSSQFTTPAAPPCPPLAQPGPRRRTWRRCRRWSSRPKAT